ncbi:MAG: MtnX-like HAD-IB family phosphatase [Ignavibacteriales bacterium]|nr:MtnX-like HAD-IB family phosphatase [Ignavibacteriales bacterium]MCB9218487.1 MtnX-like HAD-IB family phosphatase [Ignavibacteriales bacterium]
MNYNHQKNFKIYIDFDGTITTKDIGEHMFLEFGNPAKSREIISKWLTGDYNSKEVWIKLCETIKNFDENKFDTFLENISIDPYFIEFVKFAKEKNFVLTILSDGLDYYINKISKRENFSDLSIYCNKLIFDADGKLCPQFPYTDEECNKCANCKRNHIINSSSDDDITIYIGDGWSDTCAAEHCDFIFAKRSLLKYCEQNGVPYFQFEDFSDVKKIVDQLYNKKKIKKRHQAELKRKDAYMQG